MNKTIHSDLKYATEDKIKELLEESQGQITANNIEGISELIDIYKDIANVKYWCKKEEGESMHYGNYGNYGRGSYNERGSYGRRERDSRGRYKGHDCMDEMYDYYGRYEEGREQARRGNYGAKDDSMKSLEYMLESVVDFMEMLHREADSQEEVEMIKKYARKISEM